MSDNDSKHEVAHVEVRREPKRGLFKNARM
jgi:hypothetical protein